MVIGGIEVMLAPWLDKPWQVAPAPLVSRTTLLVRSREDWERLKEAIERELERVKP